MGHPYRSWSLLAVAVYRGISSFQMGGTLAASQDAFPFVVGETKATADFWQSERRDAADDRRAPAGRRPSAESAGMARRAGPGCGSPTIHRSICSSGMAFPPTC